MKAARDEVIRSIGKKSPVSSYLVFIKCCKSVKKVSRVLSFLEDLKMPVLAEEIITACKLVAEQREIKVCLKAVAKGAAWSSGLTIVGGLVGGLVGMAVGSALGGLVGYCTSEDFKPLHQIIQEMDESDKAKLVDHMRKILAKLDITDAAALLALVKACDSAEFNDFVKALCAFKA